MSWLDDGKENKEREQAQAGEQAARLGAQRVDPLISNNISELGRRVWGEGAYLLEQKFEPMIDRNKRKYRCRWMCIGRGQPGNTSDIRRYYFHVDVIFTESGEVDMWGHGIALSGRSGLFPSDEMGQALHLLLSSVVRTVGKVNPLNETTLRAYLKDQFKEGPRRLDD